MMMETGIRNNITANFLHTYNGKAKANGTAITLQVALGQGGRTVTPLINTNSLQFNQSLKSISQVQLILWKVLILLLPVIPRHLIPSQPPPLRQREILPPAWSHSFLLLLRGAILATLILRWEAARHVAKVIYSLVFGKAPKYTPLVPAHTVISAKHTTPGWMVSIIRDLGNPGTHQLRLPYFWLSTKLYTTLTGKLFCNHSMKYYRLNL
jgi:hypothetical protein